MTNIEKVKRILDAGHWVKVIYLKGESKGLTYIFTSYKNDTFSYIPELSLHLYTMETEFQDCTIEVIQRIPTPYVEGDKVLVLSNPSPGDEDREAMIGKVMEVNCCHHGYYRGLNDDKSDWIYFPSHCLAPAFDEDSLSGKEAKVVIDGKWYNVTLKLI